MNDILKGHAYLFEDGREILKKLSFQNPAAKLSRLTNLRAKLDKDTQQSSTYTMLERCILFYTFFSGLELPDVNDFASVKQTSHVEALCQKLSDSDSIIKKLQDPAVAQADVCILFDEMCTDICRELF